MSKDLDDLINEKVNKIKERKSKEYLESLEYIDKWLYEIKFTQEYIILDIRGNQDKNNKTYLRSTLYLPDEKSNLYTSFPNLKKLIGLYIDKYSGDSELFDKLKELIINELKKMQDRFEIDVVEMNRDRIYY